ncbi:MAG: HAMP domain-containing protein [Saprospiraceae bacterium]|nr:HAMP domain-containing protein [Saprospiraceae bacterium]
MNLKTKLTLGIVLLFGLLVLVSALGMFNVNALATDASAILKDNYETLEYVQAMQRALESLEYDPSSQDLFRQNLERQAQNITEAGEGEATALLAGEYKRLERQPADSLARANVRRQLLVLADLNLQAIARKNEQVLHTASGSTMLLGVIATFCVLIGFVFLLNFPGYIANPVRQLTEGIQEIARGNYEQRILLDRHDEFGVLAGAFNELAGKLDAYQHSNLARLMFEKKRLETVIGAMHDPVIGLDEHHRVLFANEPALALFHLPPGKLIGKDAREVALTNDLLRTLLTHPGQPGAEPLKIFADGKESFFLPEAIDIAVRAEATDTAQGIGQVLVLKNVTQFRERDVAKTNFIATISHELKTPISSIKMGLRLLEDERIGTLNEEQNHLLRQLGQDAGRLLNITGELLKIAQAETGNIQITLAPADPGDIVETAREILKTEARDKQIDIDVAPLPQPAALALADADKTTWVLVNLLSNAIRYSPEHQPIQIAVEQQGDKIRFSVRDHGPGVPEMYREKIFERFFRMPGTLAGGTGLGLAISREFVWAMGGDIGVENLAGGGSSFWFTLRKV